jgi:hypothetical protein
LPVSAAAVVGEAGDAVAVDSGGVAVGATFVGAGNTAGVTAGVSVIGDAVGAKRVGGVGAIGTEVESGRQPVNANQPQKRAHTKAPACTLFMRAIIQRSTKRHND